MVNITDPKGAIRNPNYKGKKGRNLKKLGTKGNKRNDVGLSREKEVAKLTNGKVAKDAKGNDIKVPIYRPDGVMVKNTTVDVIGSNGEFIAVGGPGKASGKTKAEVKKSLDQLQTHLSDLKAAASHKGVKSMAYFTENTPKSVIDIAKKTLGPDNVKLF